jgi:hypothetical protein
MESATRIEFNVVTGELFKVPLSAAEIAEANQTTGLKGIPPQSITRGQCARELFEREMISGDEMVAMTAVGQPPEFIAEYFDLLPARERSIAYADFARDNYLRGNPLLNSTLSAFGSDAAGIDDFFREAATR